MNTEQHITPSQARQRWQTLLQRKRQDEFVYAVLSTGVVCRTGCPSRPPNIENVRYFATVADAVRDGFRPCRRCMQDDDYMRVATLCRHIEQAEDKNLAQIARANGLSSRQVQRLFRKLLGITPKQYEIQCRFKQFLQHIRAGMSVTDAIYSAGFRSSSRMYAQLRSRVGMNNLSLRQAGSGELVFYASRRTSLGVVVMAQTLIGLCFAGFFDDAEEGIAALKQQFAAATAIEVQNHQLEPIASAFEQAISGDYAGLAGLPLDIQGTAFQSSVWEAVRQVPVGRRVSYSELAATINKPKHSRAVANALASNRIALAIPCHRVLPADGKAGGYRWGSERKVQLLQNEQPG